MAYNQNQAPFWDWVRAFENRGAGVDHPAQDFSFFGPPPPPPPPGSHPPPPPPDWSGFPFAGPDFFSPRGGFGFGPRHGPGPHHGGRRGRHGRRRDGPEGRDEHESRSRSRSHSSHNERTDGEGEAREDSPHGHRGPHGPHGRPGFGPRRGGWGGARGGWGGHCRRGPPPFGGFEGRGQPFDLSGLFASLASHPLAQAFRTYAEQSGMGAQQSGDTVVPEDSENSFTPPIDVFSTEKEYVLHVALPGAKKEDVGVNWDSEKGVLNLAGVVYRQGDEEFLKTLSQSERKVGVFERTVKLPPGDEEKEEIDSDAISAKLEDGVLVVTVPKVEKEWTEVKRVDIV